MVSLDRVKACSNPTCRLLLPADCDDPLAAGFYVRTREAGRVTRFGSRCKECRRQARRDEYHGVDVSRHRRANVRVIERDGRLVQVRICACGTEGECTDGPDSPFPVNARDENGRVVGWHVDCRKCHNQKQRDRRSTRAEKVNRARRERHAERMRTDPEYRETRRRATRDLYASSPERRAKIAAASTEWHKRKRKEDPEHLRELARLGYALRRDREGGTVDHRAGTVIDHTAPRLRAGPFYEWLVAYQKVSTDSVDALAAALDVVPRRIREVLERKGDGNVTVDVVDRALLNATMVVRVGGRGIFRLDDLYPA